MTREEAINKVQGYLTDYLPIEDYEELDEIIKALEQEQKTKIVTCKDCKHGRNGICPNYRDFIDDDFYCASAERCYK